MRQHLVNDQLEEDGGRQTQNVHGHGGNENVSESSFVFQNFRNEPPKSKGLVGVGQLVLALEQEHIARPNLAEGGLVHQRDHSVLRVEHGNFVVGLFSNTDHNHGFAFSCLGNQRKYAILLQQRLPRHFHDLGLHANVGSNAHQEQVARLFLAKRVFGNDALWINLQPMMLGHSC